MKIGTLPLVAACNVAGCDRLPKQEILGRHYCKRHAREFYAKPKAKKPPRHNLDGNFLVDDEE